MKTSKTRRLTRKLFILFSLIACLALVASGGQQTTQAFGCFQYCAMNANACLSECNGELGPCRDQCEADFDCCNLLCQGGVCP
jgi:hypothetical protein